MFSIEGDDDAWDESDRLEKEWCENLLKPDSQQVIASFVAKHRQGIPTEVSALGAGGLNALLRVHFLDGASAVIRFAKPGKTMFPEEKIRIEVATMRYIQDHTSIPVPFVLHWGTKDESPLGLGAFIIMEYVNYNGSMTVAMQGPVLSRDVAPVIDPNIDEEKLESLYRQVSGILLQLSKLEFPLIGALEEIDEWQWEVRKRPLSMPLNELVRIGTFPRAKLPTGTFQSSSEYIKSLASLHVDHLFHQRNDIIESETDCRRKYTARKLFQKLAQEKKLVPDSHGPFKFWCDDLRPSNILLNDRLEIAAVIDWEYSYAAPCEYTYSPPWWLLIERPEYWAGGLADWTEKYERRLKTFLKAMTESENAGIAAGQLREDQRLSGRMRESWDSGDFWTVYAARKSFGFDDAYWAKLDHRFFGPHEGKLEDAWMQRLALLDEQTRAGMEPLVAKKLEEMKSRELAWEPDE
ncbi:hypothetical protein MY11210_004312 [Beauveria gryllotalpidicola]